MPKDKPIADQAAEQAVLGAILVAPDKLHEIIELIRPEDFYREAHGKIFQAMLDLSETDTPIDLVSVSAHLKDKGHMEAIGGSGFLAGLSEQVGFATNIKHYAQIIHDKSTLRRLYNAALNIQKDCVNSPGLETQEVLERAQNSLNELIGGARGKRKKNITELVGELIVTSDGLLMTSDVHLELGVTSRDLKKQVNEAMRRFAEQGKLTPCGDKRGCYRIVKESEEIDWLSADINNIYPIKWPFELEKYVTIYPGNIIVVAGEKGSGKGHPHGTPILTPVGWIPIEQLKVGDIIFDENGKFTNITGVYPKGLQQTFKIGFNDHTSILCDFDHLWTVKRQRRGGYKPHWETLPTYSFLSQYLNKPWNPSVRNWIIPKAGPIQFVEKDVLIDPYVLGTLLGDGCLCKSSIEICSADDEIIGEIEKKYKVSKRQSLRSAPNYTVLGLMPLIKTMGLSGKRSWEKFVPIEYLYNSPQNRLDLLQGLMDTDGTVSKTGKNISFATTSKQLVDDVMFLVRSLGGKVSLGKERHTHYRHKGEYKKGRKSYRIQITMYEPNPFRLYRKAVCVKPYYNHTNKVIHSIENAGIQSTICISVGNPTGLYVTKDFIVTHNSAFMYNLIRLNQDTHKIIYFNSESGKEEMKLRLSKFEDMPLDSWKFKTYARSSNFPEAIHPDRLNIIDYYEMTDNFYQIGGEIRQIHERLKKGICVIALQKKRGAEFGRGGDFSREKARLYLTMEQGKLKIVDGKIWASDVNPNGIEFFFKLVGGSKFLLWE